MSDILTLDEKRRVALFVKNAEGIWEGFGQMTRGDVAGIVGEARAALVASTVNGMMALIGYHETVNALNAPTRNDAIVKDLALMWEAIDENMLDLASDIHSRLSETLFADPELAEAGALIARLRLLADD